MIKKKKKRNKTREKMKLQVLFLVVMLSLAYTQLVKGQSIPGCKTSCGNVTLEYPFGISTGCYYAQDRSFNLTCNKEGKLIFGNNVEVIKISHNGELRVKLEPSYTCYNIQENGSDIRYHTYTLGNLSLSAKNKFTLVGCNVYALVTTYGTRNYSTGCLSACNSLPAANTECKGEGCCRTDVSVPLDSYEFETIPDRLANMDSVYGFNPCAYSFLVEDGMFNFSSREDLRNLRNVTEFPVVLDWSIGDQTCEQAGGGRLCRGNSECFNSTRGTGYNCKCTQGYEGNPYLPYSCQDIDECNHAIHRHNCSTGSSCENTPGRFLCTCKSGYHLNTTDNTCMPDDTPGYFEWTRIVLGTTVGFLLILLVASCIQQRMKHRKNTQLRQQFFEQNGGGMLIQRLSGAGPSNVDVQIFTEEGMKTATDNYDESRILGQGGQGTVYKGILPDSSVVAIKKARLGDSSQVEQFINEVLVLSQINHRNVVKLLGCCLETEVPLLVYEFIASGTLFDHLHEQRLHEVIDGQVWNENNQREIQEVARVAVECTRVTGEERPRMKEVAAELEGLRATKTKHQWSDQYTEPMETEHLLGVEILSAQGDTSSIGYDSIKNVARLDIEAGR
ncbi:unnamed protein product [Thlaspi arvense]|uniref:Uncharacterized protein n=1 Tax=Thlaspi arvense TaxID=13288 RepID=A0AAU9RA44_THLAR|nr:unnamed protein product [Thlaspi arvense]